MEATVSWIWNLNHSSANFIESMYTTFKEYGKRFREENMVKVNIKDKKVKLANDGGNCG